MFGAILGTGVGGGIVVRGRPVRGPNAVTGEWGHIQVPWPKPSELPGPDCYCGRSGCVETYLSGPGMEGDFARMTGKSSTSRGIVESARRGDSDASACLDRYVDRLARGLAAVINVLGMPALALLSAALGYYLAVWTL